MVVAVAGEVVGSIVAGEVVGSGCSSAASFEHIRFLDVCRRRKTRGSSSLDRRRRCSSSSSFLFLCSCR